MSTYSFASSSDFTGGYRLDLARPVATIATCTACSRSTAVSASANGATGVTLNLANGKQATVTFNRDSVGGTLTYDGVTTSLVAGVAALPE